MGILVDLGMELKGQVFILGIVCMHRRPSPPGIDRI